MIDIPVWLFGVLIATNFFVDLVVFLIIYFIAGIHDLFFVKYYSTKNKVKNDCPYYVEGDVDERE